MSEDVGDESQMEYISSSENDDGVDENTRVKTIEEGNDGETTSSDDDIGGGARNLTSKVVNESRMEYISSSEYDDAFDENTRVKLTETNSDEYQIEENTLVQINSPQKGITYHIENCTNFQIGEKNKQGLDVIEERFTKQQETIEVLQQTIQGHQQAIHALQEADTTHKQATQEHQQAIHALQEKVTEQQESISGLEHSVNIQQEEIQSLKMKVNPKTSIESSPPPKVANQNKDVKLSSGNLNEEVLSDKTTKQIDKGHICEEEYQDLLRWLQEERDKGHICEEEYQDLLSLLRWLQEDRDEGYICEETYQKVLENLRDKGYMSLLRWLQEERDKGHICEKKYQDWLRVLENMRFLREKRYKGHISEEEYLGELANLRELANQIEEEWQRELAKQMLRQKISVTLRN